MADDGVEISSGVRDANERFLVKQLRQTVFDSALKEKNILVGRHVAQRNDRERERETHL